MLHFDGVLRSCVKYKRVPKVGLRCVEFQEGLKRPKCPGKGMKLKGGGRSQNYIRGEVRPCASDTPAPQRRKTPRNKRPSSRK